MTRLRQIGAFLRVDLIVFVRFWHVSLFMVGMTTFYFLMLTRFAPVSMQSDVTLVFIILAVLSVALLHFGQRVSLERSEQWSPFVRTLPVPTWAKLAARLLLVLMVGALAAVLIMVAGAVRFGVVYDLRSVVTGIIAVPLAAAVFAPISACIGGWASPNGISPLTTTAFLTVTWSSGVWTAGRLPGSLAPVEFLLPVQAIQGAASAAASAQWAQALPDFAVAVVWALPAYLLALRLNTVSEAV
ncbi:hypothetical protein DFP74_4998 [Nocardiopsis sp. Huas11]|uniref:hypothetical protein n=1 Tax=Nocardiopsis sp. Huas11 TaxID=2183912 RepID=UPI000EB13615|nr:hypothetical protein [Nocardiopsis sp. Huas11]RKS09265.1 hypothetical protein DFP74_4998 [Nocardiopsis sp. Huas11]